MNPNLLKGKIKEMGYIQSDIATMIGISLQSFNHKVNGKRKFNLDEVVKICKELKIDEPNKIFLTRISQICNKKGGAK